MAHQHVMYCLVPVNTSMATNTP